MKKNVILLMVAFMMTIVYAQAQNQSTLVTGKPEAKVKVNGPVAKWDQTENNMGEIPQGIPKAAQFTLSNEGNEPLIISSAQASCGCTNLNYSKEPLLPGKSTTISATYNAAVKGNFFKTITVRTNASDQPTVLQIKGNVVEKQEEKK